MTDYKKISTLSIYLEKESILSLLIYVKKIKIEEAVLSRRQKIANEASVDSAKLAVNYYLLSRVKLGGASPVGSVGLTKQIKLPR